VCTGLTWLRIGTSGGLFKFGNEPLVPQNAEKFLSGCTTRDLSNSAQLHRVKA
jgi:hypothetical protein